MKTFSITRLFASLVATAMILFPVTDIFADNNSSETVHIHSVLHVSPPPSIPRPELIDAEGNPIFWSFVADTSQTLLFNQDPFFVDDEIIVPILDTMGNQINLRDWMKARGKLSIRCQSNGRGTRYRFWFTGLIPNGIYTVWHFPDTGSGALATTFPFDQIDNVFQASNSGKANFAVLAEPGVMSFGGEMPACSLTQSLQELFVVLYHIDGEYCGPFPCNTPGNPSVEVAHMFFKR